MTRPPIMRPEGAPWIVAALVIVATVLASPCYSRPQNPSSRPVRSISGLPGPGRAAQSARRTGGVEKVTLTNCTGQPDGAACDDGNGCTVGETCRSESCLAPASFAQAAGSPVGAGTQPNFVAAGDMNGDGRLDLAMANYASNNVTVLLGNGLGGFSQAAGSPVGVGPHPVSVAVGDWNGDGKPDLAVANNGSNSLTILLGNGIGGFSLAGSPIAVGTDATSVAAGDWNADGKLDLAVGSGNLTILLGNGSGGFSPAAGSPIAAGTDAYYVVVGDWNGDGKLDLAVVNAASNSVTTLLGNGAGGFGEAAGSPALVGDFPVSAGTGDWNGDGKIDLAVVNFNDSNVTFLLGNGTGGFSMAAGSPVTVGAFPYSITAEDWNGDGRLDAAVANQGSNSVTILLGNGTGGFSGAAGSPVAVGTQPSVAAGDWNRDGRPDLATANSGDGNVTVLLNSTTSAPDGTACDDGNACTVGGTCRTGICLPPVSFVQSAGSPVGAGTTPVSVAAADLSGDGKLDVAVANQNTNGVRILLGNGTGGFSPAPGSPIAVGTTPVSVATGDWNADGSRDLAVANSDSNDVTILLGNGSGGFSGAAGSPVAVGTGPRSIAAGYWNGDGRLDLAVANRFSDNVTILLGNGSGGFSVAAGSPVAVDEDPYSVAAGDVNGDGKADLAVANYVSGSVTILLGNGAGSFSQATGSPVAVGTNPESVAIADVNGDGSLDLAVANAGSNNVSILLGNGSGGFNGAVGSPVAVGTFPESITASDWNGDGKVDLAVVNGTSNNVSILLGNGLGGFSGTAGSPVTVGTHPTSIAVGDASGDGRPDLVVANFSSASLTILLNGTPTVPDGTPCSDGNVCSTNDVCSAGTCAGNCAAVTGVTPADDSQDIDPSTDVTLTYSQPIDPATVTASTVRLLDGAGLPVSAALSVSPSSVRVTIDPDIRLASDAIYTVQTTVGVKDVDGIASFPYTSEFRTAAPGAPPDISQVSDQSQTPPGSTQSLAGSATASGGDLNGDGKTDFITGAPGYSVTAAVVMKPVAKRTHSRAGSVEHLTTLPETGAAFVYFGSGDAAQRQSPDIIYTGAAAHDRAGVSVAGGFDFNGDGTLDILIGAEQVDRTVLKCLGGGNNGNTCSTGANCPGGVCGNPPVGAGTVYLIYFDPTDTTHYPNINNPSLADTVSLSSVGQPGPAGIPGVVFQGVALGDQAGFAVAAGGRIDPGVGQDILIGAPGRDPDGTSDAGAVYAIFSGGPTGTKNLATAGQAGLPGVVYKGAASGDRLGFAVAFPGDVMGTAGDDIAMSSPLADTNPHGTPLPDAGIVYIAQGGSLGSATVTVSALGGALDGSQLPGEQAGEQFGFSIAGGGDNQVDGNRDLLVGAPFHDVGANENAGFVAQSSIRFGRGIVDVCRIGANEAGGLSGVAWVGAAAGDQLGHSVAGVSDVTGNGFDDVVLGAPFADPTTMMDAGVVYLIDGATTAADLRGELSTDQVGNTIMGQAFAGTQPGENAGASLAGTGDLSGDGTNDFVVGAPGKDTAGGTASGTTYEVLQTAPEAPGVCGPGGCLVTDLGSGAQLNVPAGSLSGSTSLSVTGILSAGGLPAPPPSGKTLLGAADFDPENQTFGAPSPNACIAARTDLQSQITNGETFPFYRFTGSGWILSGSSGTVGGNPVYAGRKAVTGTVPILHVYAVFLNDLDGDGARDELDPDRDGDGIANTSDNCPNDTNALQFDCDHDGTGDACDLGTADADLDRVDDVCDNCPGLANPTQANQDGDASGDSCDPCSADAQNDADGDGICVGVGYRAPKTGDRDNCPATPNPSQRDVDSDGVGDACDTNVVFRASSKPSDNPDFTTIQAAVNAATESGTRIEILPGLGPYNENVVVNRNLALSFVRRDNGSGSPVVVDGGSGNAFDVLSTSGSFPIDLRGLTLRGQKGIRTSVSTRITDCAFESITGIAIDLDGGVNLVSGATMDATVASGVDLAVGASLTLQNSRLVGLGGTALTLAGSAQAETCLIAAASNGILVTGSGTLDLRHSTVAGVSGAGVQKTGSGAVIVSHSILYGNAGGDLINVPCPQVSWSDVGAPDCSSVNSNLSANPLFTSGYHLGNGSPCLDHGPSPATFTGSPCRDLDGDLRLRDFDGDGFARIDPGAYERPRPAPSPGDVPGLRWTGPTTMVWDQEPSASEYHVYRGVIGTLSFSSFGACRDDLDPNRTDRVLTDSQPPAPGGSFFYLITAESGGEFEGSLGLGTCAEESRFDDCP